MWLCEWGMSINMATKTIIIAELIAPCGMNCAICMGHLLREKNKMGLLRMWRDNLCSSRLLFQMRKI